MSISVVNEEQSILHSTLRRLVKEVIEPRAREVNSDPHPEFPRDVVDLLSKTGILHLGIPEQYGGAGAGLDVLCFAAEEIGRGDVSTALLLSSQWTAAIHPLIHFGSEEQKKTRFGEMLSGALAGVMLTEPDAGSDVATLKTVARRADGGHSLSGNKCFISLAGLAKFYVTYAKTDPSLKHRGITAFIVEDQNPGLRVGRIDSKMGLHGFPTGEVFLEDAFVPDADLLGEVGRGFEIVMKSFDSGRAVIGAIAVGAAAGSVSYAADYARNRHQFGSAISDFQGIRFMLADMAMEVEAARQLVHRAVEAIQAEDPSASMYSAMAKCFATDVAMKVTTDAVQVLGGSGYMNYHPLERMMRDVKVLQIFEGTNQIQRVIIARHLLGREADQA